MPQPGLKEAQYPTPLPAHPLRVFTLTGARPGPTLALIGAVHGDELEGPLTLSALMQTLDPAALSGRLILCPGANPAALAASTRCSPHDGLNLARSFPGAAGGSYTQVLAALIAEHVIGPADAMVDLHSGGGPLDCPLFAGFSDALPASAALASAFGAPVIWRHPAPLAAGRSLSQADACGIPAFYVEAGGGTVPGREALQAYAAGLQRVMAEMRMLERAADTRVAPLRVVGNGDLDAAVAAPATGLCACKVGLLDTIFPGQTCFEISDLDGTMLATVSAETSGVAMFLRRSRWVNAGELLMAMATPDDTPAL